MRKYMLYFFYFSKRLFKKKSYLILLVLIPLMIRGMMQIAVQDSGILRIMVMAEDKESEKMKDIFSELLNQDSVILIEEAQDKEMAYQLLNAQKLDAIWIFRENFDDLLLRYVEQYKEGLPTEALVEVVVREDNVALQLAREKLYGVLAPHLYYAMYQEYIKEFWSQEREEVVGLSEIYEKSKVDDCLVQFSYIDGTVEEKPDYLVTPLRGMLAILIVLAGFAAVMYYIQDEETGIMDNVPMDKRLGRLHLYQFTVLIYPALAALIALGISGLMTRIGYEVFLMLLFLFQCMGFCVFLKQVLGQPRRLGIGMVICVLMMLMLCPVFFVVKKARMIQYLLPPFFYLSAVHNLEYVVNMIIYCIISSLFNLFLAQVRNKYGK